MDNYTSLPQINKASLEYLLTRETEKGRKVSNTESSSSEFRIERSLKELAPGPETNLFDKMHIYFEPYGTPLENRERLLSFRKCLVEVAEDFGFPNKINPGVVRKFDQELAKTLWIEGKKLGISVANASLEGTWYYLQGIVTLDLVAWRWMNWSDKTFNKDRVASIIRGGLSNVWWRYNVLTNNGRNDYEDWMDLLTQDDVGAIIERTKMRGYSPIIIPFAKHVADIRKRQGEDKISGKDATRLIRAAAKRMRMYVGFRNSWQLERKSADFDKLVNDVFADAEKMLE